MLQEYLQKIYTLGLIISLNFRYKAWGSLMQNAFRRQIHRGKSRLVQITWHSAKKKTKNNCIVYGFSLGGNKNILNSDDVSITLQTYKAIKLYTLILLYVKNELYQVNILGGLARWLRGQECFLD